MSTALIVEDSLTDKELLSACLERGGIKVLTAQTAEEALDQIKHNSFDVIILDIVLPDRSGFDICRELKETEGTRRIPVIMCSTKSSEMDKFWGMKQGADAYLAKPIDQDELLKAVKQLLTP